MEDTVGEEKVGGEDTGAIDEVGVRGEGDGYVTSVEGFQTRGLACGEVEERGVPGPAVADYDVIFEQLVERVEICS